MRHWHTADLAYTRTRCVARFQIREILVAVLPGMLTHADHALSRSSGISIRQPSWPPLSLATIAVAMVQLVSRDRLAGQR